MKSQKQNNVEIKSTSEYTILFCFVMICVSYKPDEHIRILAMASNAYHFNFCNVPLTIPCKNLLNAVLVVTLDGRYQYASKDPNV